MDTCHIKWVLGDPFMLGENFNTIYIPNLRRKVWSYRVVVADGLKKGIPWLGDRSKHGHICVLHIYRHNCCVMAWIQIVNAVVVRVPGIKETLDILHGVAVVALDFLWRVPHGNDVLRDVFFDKSWRSVFLHVRSKSKPLSSKRHFSFDTIRFTKFDFFSVFWAWWSTLQFVFWMR
jgi:hypothetical protein